MKILETRRLRLRPMNGRDLRTLHCLYGDPELMRYITGRPRNPWETRARLKIDLAHHKMHGFGLCIAEARKSGEAIGRCGLIPRPVGDGLEGELAWMFAKPWWGRGLATEAGSALMDFGLQELGLRRVFATALTGNVASIRIMEKLGMKRAGTYDGEVEYECVADARE